MLGTLSRASNKGYMQLYGKSSSTVTEWGLYESFRVWGQRSEAAVNDARLAWGARARSSLNQIWGFSKRRGVHDTYPDIFLYSFIGTQTGTPKFQEPWRN